MISIIVCSINENLFKKFAENVAITIGTSYEIIKIDNSANLYSLAEAYNHGAEKATFPYLCFVHEDVLFVTNDWGVLLLNSFACNPQTGAIGIAGSNYKSLSPSGWPTLQQNLDNYNFIQYFHKWDKNILQTNGSNGNQSLAEVKVIDGVFICTTKIIWNNNKFDSKTFSGFHAYDLDFSLQVGIDHKIMITYQILLVHRSEGVLGKEWIKQVILLSKKWKNHLPQGNLCYKERVRIEWQQKRIFFLNMLIHKYAIKDALFVFFDFGYCRYFSFRGNMLFSKEILQSFWRKIFKTTSS